MKLPRLARACFLITALFVEAVFGATAEDASLPPIGSIDYYGLRTVSVAEIRQVLGLKEGDPAPVDPARRRELERRIAELPGVVQARIAGVCCDEGKATVFVGIEEKGAPKLTFRPAPSKEILLPRDIVEMHERFEKALVEAIRKGDSADDMSQGHSLMANAACREVQQEFITCAASQLKTLRSVVRDSGNAKHRAIATWILGYAPDKRAVVDDLVYALEDNDPEVRNNATRSLAAIGALATRKPQLKIHIPIARFIAMLHSVEWTDRNKGLAALQNLVTRSDEKALKELRQRALPALVEMARWQSQGHAYAAYVLVGRIAGLDEDEITTRWPKERETVITKALAMKS